MILPMDGDEALRLEAWDADGVLEQRRQWSANRCSRRTGGGSRMPRMRQDAVKCTCARFPGPGAAVQISTGGGGTPTWSRDEGRDLLRRPTAQIMVVPYAVERNSFRAGKPRLWSEGRYQTRGPNRMFDLHPDGERFVLAPATKPPDDHSPSSSTFSSSCAASRP